MKLRNKAAKSGSSPVSCSPLPDRVCVPQAEWDALDETSRKFLIEAEDGGLRYLAENGEVCAWGSAYEALFSMDVEAQSDPDGYLITLANVGGAAASPKNGIEA